MQGQQHHLTAREERARSGNVCKNSHSSIINYYKQTGQSSGALQSSVSRDTTKTLELNEPAFVSVVWGYSSKNALDLL